MFHGAADLRTLQIDKILTSILEEGPYDGPIDLRAERDFSTEATIDAEIFYETIIKKIFCMGFDPILKDLASLINYVQTFLNLKPILNKST